VKGVRSKAHRASSPDRLEQFTLPAGAFIQEPFVRY
jgi:hypothetical protein